MATYEQRIAQPMKNAFVLSFTEGLSNHVREEGQALVDDLDDDEERPFNIPIDHRGIRLFLVHSMGLSYIEASSVLLLHDTIDRELEPECTQLLEYVEDDRKYRRFIRDAESRTEKLRAILEKLYGRRTGASDYERLLKNSDILEKDLVDRISEVRKSRNRLVHSPTSILNFRTGSEVKETIQDCIDVVTEVEKMCREKVLFHDIYHDFTDYQHRS